MVSTTRYYPHEKPIYTQDRLLQTKLSELEQRIQPGHTSTLLRQGVYGYTDSRTGEGLFATGLPDSLDVSVQQHEIAHSLLGLDGSPRGEYLADTWALYKTGKINFFRGIGYRPPIGLN